MKNKWYLPEGSNFLRMGIYPLRARSFKLFQMFGPLWCIELFNVPSEHLLWRPIWFYQIWRFLEIPVWRVFSYPWGFPDFYWIEEDHQSVISYAPFGLFTNYMYIRIKSKINVLDTNDTYLNLSEIWLQFQGFWGSWQWYQGKGKKPFFHGTAQMMLWVSRKLFWVFLTWG